jgi:lysine 6-dehydrogenase
VRYLILGVGNVGRGVARRLLDDPDTETVTLVSRDWVTLTQIQDQLDDERVEVREFEVTPKNVEEVGDDFSQYDVVISLLPERYNYELARAAILKSVHFFDVGMNLEYLHKEYILADEAVRAGVTVVPAAGISPGFVNALVKKGVEEFDEVEAVRIRTGDLPVKPKPPLNYAMVYSVESLVEDYTKDTEVLRDGKRKRAESLTGLEEVDCRFFPVKNLEAFYTSAGVSTLPQTMASAVKNLDYKTIRYAGHMQKVAVLKELGFFSSSPVAVGSHTVSPKEFTASLLKKVLPKGTEDIFLGLVEVEGRRRGEYGKLVYSFVVEYSDENGETALVKTVSTPVVALISMLKDGLLPSGVLYIEREVPVDEFVRRVQDGGVPIQENFVRL